jgi:hypothetical protein
MIFRKEYELFHKSFWQKAEKNDHKWAQRTILIRSNTMADKFKYKRAVCPHHWKQRALNGEDTQSS